MGGWIGSTSLRPGRILLLWFAVSTKMSYDPELLRISPSVERGVTVRTNDHSPSSLVSRLRSQGITDTVVPV